METPRERWILLEPGPGDPEFNMALDEALDRLEAYDPRLARVVECRYFTGLTEVETAGALGVSERTVRRAWVKARTLLQQILAD